MDKLFYSILWLGELSGEDLIWFCLENELDFMDLGRFFVYLKYDLESMDWD